MFRIAFVDEGTYWDVFLLQTFYHFAIFYYPDAIGTHLGGV